MLEVIKSNFVSLKPDDTVKKALDEMEKNKKSVAVVVDEENNLKGIIVKSDIFKFLRTEGHIITCPVEWAMTKEVITAKKEDDILTIAKILREKDITAVPIVEKEKVLGLVSLEDVVDYFIKIMEKK
ncbi:CBS domain-containing protein [Caloramator fervidus]|uniref:CBS domain-containing protein n=1 Tax=Caloramator fervidus TaxID=29344 RepID=A0A1H5XV32_9CLOT|nr:CBS domain-containing protein [Caloramator fervidus]SEG15395.1 CBS domain-containing protein [Caloramator fervidus]